MKTKFSTIAILLTLVTIFNKTTFASEKFDKGTVIKEAKNFTRIEIRGNVEVYLMDGEANSVKALNNYYGENALVQNQNGTLRISSFSKEALVVYVTVADLRNLSVYDNAAVKTSGHLSAIELDVNLYNNAAAQLNLNAFNANIRVNDRATADLTGIVTNCDVQINKASTVNTTTLVAENMTKTATGIAAVVKDVPELVVM